MKQLEKETISTLSAEDCAALVMDAVPLVMRTIRAEMRGHRAPGLSVPQFRALGYLGRHPGCSLSDLAEHLGLTLPTISKMIDHLEADGLLSRAGVLGDRRRVALSLTGAGNAALQAATGATRARLADLLDGLTPGERELLGAAMRVLSNAFTLPGPHAEASP